MSLNDYKDLATMIGVVIALAALAKGVFEYVRQGAQKRSEQFIELRNRFKENVCFKDLADLLETDDPKLAMKPFADKRDYLGFFEEVALMVNSRLISPQVAHYMFGYYAIRCWESEYFWAGVNRESPYWALFKDFALRMKEMESSFEYRRKRLRF